MKRYAEAKARSFHCCLSIFFAAQVGANTFTQDAFKKAADMPFKADNSVEKESHDEAAGKYAKYQKY